MQFSDFSVSTISIAAVSACFKVDNAACGQRFLCMRQGYHYLGGLYACLSLLMLALSAIRAFCTA